MRFESLTPIANALRFVNSHGGIHAFVTADGFVVKSEAVHPSMEDWYTPAFYAEVLEHYPNIRDNDRVTEEFEVFPVSEAGMVSLSALRSHLGY